MQLPLISVFLKNSNKYFLAWFLLMMPFAGSSQVTSVSSTKIIKTQALTLSDGLSQSLVTSIVQDKNGFMWFGTKDGLNKYDGYRFSVYRHNPKDSNTLTDNTIFSIRILDNGFLLVYYYDGRYDLFNPEKESTFHLSDLSDKLNGAEAYTGGRKADYKNPLYVVTEERKSKKNKLLQISTCKSETTGGFGYGLYIKDLTTYLPATVNGKQLSFIFIDSKKQLILNYNDTFLFYKHADQVLREKPIKYPYTRFSQKAVYDGGINLPYGPAQPILEDTVQHQYYVYAGYSFTLYNTQTNEKTDSVDIHLNTLLCGFDKKGRVWFTNFGNRLFVYDNQLKQITEIFPIAKNNFNTPTGIIRALYIDHSNVLWLSIDGFGLLKYNINSDRFTHVVSSNVTNKSIMGIWQGCDKNTLWLLSSIYKIWRYERNTAQTLEPFPLKLQASGKKQESNNYDIYWTLGFYANTSQNFFLSFESNKNAVLRATSNTLKVQHRMNLPFSQPAISAGDNKGNIWLAPENGLLFKVNPVNDAFTKYQLNPKPIFNLYPFTSAIVTDTMDNLWLGTQNGLYFFHTGTMQWKYYSTKKSDTTSLPCNSILSLCNDPLASNILWIGTNGCGLVKFDRNTGKCITYTSGNTGLPNDVIYGILADKSSNLWVSTNKGICRFNPQTLATKTFTEDDGLQSNEFNRYAYCKLSTGDMVFGGINGFNIFNPDDFNVNTYMPPVNISSLKINNNEITLLSSEKLLSKSVFATKEINLTYKQNYITFGFASADYAAVNKNQFQYKLENFDEAWQPSTTLNQATYTNLDPGTYIFRVRGTNSDGIWSPHEAAITIHISPPWWGTWWFRSIIILAFLGSVYTFYRYRLLQEIKLLKIRNQIANDLHDEIGSTLSSISISSTIIQQKMGNDKSNTSDLLKQISSNTDNMMESMSDIVWTINTRNDSFESLLNRMQAFAIQMLEPQNCLVHFNAAASLHQQKLNMSQRKNLYMLFKEAVNNAAKYAGCQNLWIKIEMHGKKIFMQIKDDGRGFETSLQQNRSMGGNGLPAMQKRAEDLKGKLCIESGPGKGTILAVEFVV